MLRTGQLDWAALQNPSHVTFYLARGNVNTSSTEGKHWGTAGLWMNVTQPPFDDIRLRQAINLAINRNAITDAVYNSAASPLGPIGNAGGLIWGLDKIYTLPGNAIDKRTEIAQAKALMAEAGHPDGFSFTIHTDPRYYDPPLAVIEAQLEADLGVEIDIVRDSSYNYRFASSSGTTPRTPCSCSRDPTLPTPRSIATTAATVPGTSPCSTIPNSTR